MESDPIVVDWWDEKAGKWVFSPETLVEMSGYSSDADNFKEVTKQDAEEFMKSRKNTGT